MAYKYTDENFKKNCIDGLKDAFGVFAKTMNDGIKALDAISAGDVSDENIAAVLSAADSTNISNMGKFCIMEGIVALYNRDGMDPGKASKALIDSMNKRESEASNSITKGIRGLIESVSKFEKEQATKFAEESAKKGPTPDKDAGQPTGVKA